MSAIVSVVAAVSVGYSSLWAQREDYRYTFPVGAYAAASSSRWEIAASYHRHFESESTYEWTQVAVLGGPRFFLSSRGRWAPYVRAAVGLSHITTTYGDPYTFQPTFAVGPGVDVVASPGRRLRLGIDYRRVAPRDVPNSGISLSIGLVFGGAR